MSGKKFMVRMTGGYALRFHTNVCGKRYEAVADAEATIFSDEFEAREKAVDHGLRMNHFNVDVVEPITTHKSQPTGK